MFADWFRYDPANKRYEVPIARPAPNNTHPYSALNVQFTHDPFGMSVSPDAQTNPMYVRLLRACAAAPLDG